MAGVQRGQNIDYVIFEYSFSFASDLCNNKKEIKCDHSSRFRTIEGSCNNLDNPYWGAFGVPFVREIEVDPYDPKTDITIMDKIQGMLHK